MKMKLAFSLVLSLILLIAVSSTILLIDTPSPVLGHGSGHGSGDEDGGGNGGDGGGNGGDGGGHGGDDGGDGGDGGDDGGDGGGHNGNSGEPDADYGGGGDDDDDYYYDDYEYSDSFLQIELPEGQELGDVQNVRDIDGTILVTADGYPVLGRQLFYETGEPILDPEGRPIYFTNTMEGWMSPRVTYAQELGPGLTSGPDNEIFLYTRPPEGETSGPEQPEGEATGPGQPEGETSGPGQPEGETSGPDQPEDEARMPQVIFSPPPGAIIPTPNQDATYDDWAYWQEQLPQVEVPEQEPVELPPERSFGDFQFGEQQPILDPDGDFLLDILGQVISGFLILDVDANPVIGPNGVLIIVIIL